jgi:hypothetical protein
VFRRKFWLSLTLSVPVVVFSHMFADLLGYSMPDFPGAQWNARCAASAHARAGEHVQPSDARAPIACGMQTMLHLPG